MNNINDEINNVIDILKSFLPKRKERFEIETEKSRESRLGDVHAEAKQVFPRCFVGANVVIIREIMDRVKLKQDYNFGKQKETYQCFTQLLDKEMKSKRKDKLLICQSGSVTASYNEAIGGGYDLQLTSKIKDMVSSEMDLILEKSTEKSSGSLAFYMKDVDPHTMRCVTQLRYKVRSDFSVGAEIRFKPLYTPLTQYSVSLRYEKPSFTLSTTVAKTGFQICFFKSFAPDLKLASIISENTCGGPATVALALHKSYRGSDLKIFVDSQRCGGFVLEKDVYFYERSGERVVRLVTSTLIDRQRRLRLGFGFNLEF